MVQISLAITLLLIESVNFFFPKIASFEQLFISGYYYLNSEQFELFGSKLNYSKVDSAVDRYNCS